MSADTYDLHNLMTKLRGTSSRNEKKAYIRDFYHKNDSESIYWCFRFLVGNPLESEDDDMGVGKKTVRKAAEQAFNVRYKEIRRQEKNAGNLSDVFKGMEPQPGLMGDTPEPSTLTLSELGERIKEIAKTSGDHAKINLIADLLEEENYPQVASYAILDDISLGVSYKSLIQVLETVSSYSREELDRAHGIRSSVAGMAKNIKLNRDLNMQLKPFDRFRPMLAKDAPLPDQSDDWIGQWKYDGARVLIHKSDGEVRVFSRQRNEVTANLPEVHDINWPPSDFILDGEAVAYDPDTGEPYPFQKIMERFQREKNIEAKREEIEVQFKVFDILYYSGHGMTGESFADRHQQVLGLIQPELLAETGGDLEKVYQDALDAGHEGIIAKRLSGEYQFGRDSSWRKQKPVKEPVDVEVVGAIRGTGRHSDRLGAIKMATQEGTYVGRVGTGFSDKDRKELWDMHADNDNLIGQIIEVKFEELQENSGDYGLRFPRYERLRPEGEADTLERIKNL